MPGTEKNVANNSVGTPQYYLPSDIGHMRPNIYSGNVARHWNLLQQAVPDAHSVKPIMYMTILPFKEVSAGTSEFNNIAKQRYDMIERDLVEIAATPLEDGGVEQGAVNTAKALVSQLRSRALAPPELSWMGGEAIIMLWAISNKRLALTITDGEYAYTLRNNKQTIGRASGIKPEDFDLQRLR